MTFVVSADHGPFGGSEALLFAAKYGRYGWSAAACVPPNSIYRFTMASRLPARSVDWCVPYEMPAPSGRMVQVL